MHRADLADDELAGWLRLTLLPGIGGARQRALLKRFGLPAQVFAASETALGEVLGGPLAAQVAAAQSPQLDEAIDAALRWRREPGQHILTLIDDAYPKALLQLPDPPTLLYARGNLDVLQQPMLGMVGSRNPTAGGLENARRFARDMAEAGFCIVSGLALGIDGAAHEGALSSTAGTTIGVIGTGADRVYPARHQTLARRLTTEGRGLILSEFPLGATAQAANFPRRNRLISGLSVGVLVVEAALESGSLITARLAGEQGKEVFAIPGSIHSPQARGCHRLIKDGAKLVESVDDILGELGRPAPAICKNPEAMPGKPDVAPPEHAALLHAMGHDPQPVETLSARTGLTADALLAMLFELELGGQVAPLPGGRFQRIT